MSNTNNISVWQQTGLLNNLDPDSVECNNLVHRLNSMASFLINNKADQPDPVFVGTLLKLVRKFNEINPNCEFTRPSDKWVYNDFKKFYEIEFKPDTTEPSILDKYLSDIVSRVNDVWKRNDSKEILDVFLGVKSNR